MWEGIGGVCLLGLCISGFHSCSYFAEYVAFVYTKAVRPEEIARSIQEFSNKKVVIEGVIYSPDAPEVFSETQVQCLVKPSLPNHKNDSFMYSTHRSDFYLDSDKAIKVKPNIYTSYSATVTEEHQNRPNKLQKIISSLKIPAATLKFLLGIREENGKVITSSVLRHGEKILLTGFAVAKGLTLEVTPFLITDSKENVAASLLQKFKKSLFFPAIFALGIFIAYSRVRYLLNKKYKNSKIFVKQSMKCEICKEKLSQVTFEPCHHLCTCGDCSVLCKICPICRAAIKNSYKIFSG